MIASLPTATAPVKAIILMNSENPKRKKDKGSKENINQEMFLDKPISYQSVFFKVRPKEIKEVKQAITPKIKPSLIAPFPTVEINPETASSEVAGPVTLKIIKVKAK